VAVVDPDPDQDAYNSSNGLSDDDWDRSQFARNPNLGNQQVMSIIERRDENRVESKRDMRRLNIIVFARVS
jgi:hypothetical protein